MSDIKNAEKHLVNDKKRMTFIKCAEEILEQREDQYVRGSDKYAIFTRAASYWSSLFGKTVTREDVVKAMILFKLARCDEGKMHKDNYVDMIGYSSLLGEMDTFKEK